MLVNRLFNVSLLSHSFICHMEKKTFSKMCFPAAQRRQRVSVSCMNSERGQNTFSRNTGHKPLRWWKDERCLFAVWSFGGFSNSVLLLY